MTDTLDTLNEVVTNAVFDAEESLETAIEDWVALEKAEQAIANHPHTSTDERAVALRGVGRAQTVLAVLRGLLDAPKVEHVPLDSEPYKILVKWRSDLTDQYGADLIGLILHDFTTHNPSGMDRLPEELKPVLSAFQQLDYRTQMKHIEAILPEDVETARREGTWQR